MLGALVRPGKVFPERTAQFLQKTVSQLSPMASSKRDNKKAGSVKAPFFQKNDSDKPASLSHTNAH